MRGDMGRAERISASRTQQPPDPKLLEFVRALARAHAKRDHDIEEAKRRTKS